MIAPDRPSGEAFGEVLAKNGIEIEIMYADIEPRVIGNKMNPSPKVQADLAKAIQTGYDRGFRRMAIACNTLQLWLIEALELTPSEVGREIRVMTTFEAVGKMWADEKDRPVWLGTSVTVNAITHFPTLLTYNLGELQDLTQEIVWRTKGVTGADTGTAPKTLERIDDPEVLRQKMKLLLGGLKEVGVKTAILGCTELPIAVERYADGEDREGLALINPAQAVADAVKRWR